MKKIIKITAMLMILCTLVMSFASCSDVPEGFEGSYSTIEATDSAAIESAIAKIEELGGTKYKATYKNSSYRKFTSNGEESDYTMTYELTASVNLDAAVGGVLALYTLHSVYEQDDPTHDYDATVEICIVRTGNGQNYSDYTVYLKYGSNKYSATFSQMQEKLNEESYYGTLPDDQISEVYDLPDYESPEYFDVLMDWASEVTGVRLVSTSDNNPLAMVNHSSCKGRFESELKEVSGTSSSHKYELGKTDDGMYRIIDDLEYKVNNVTIETGNETQYIKINSDNTYSYNYSYEFNRDINEDVRKTETSRTLAPLKGDIALPAFAS